MVYRPQARIWMPDAASVAAVSLVSLKAHLRVDHDEEDEVIQGMGLAAEAKVEAVTQRLLTVRSCTLLLPGLPSDLEPIELPGGTVTELISVTVDGATLAGCTMLGRNLLVPASSWPATVATNYPVTVVYKAGFATVPVDLVHAVKLIVADLYENRGNLGNGGELPFAATALMNPWRVFPI